MQRAHAAARVPGRTVEVRWRLARGGWSTWLPIDCAAPGEGRSLLASYARYFEGRLGPAQTRLTRGRAERSR